MACMFPTLTALFGYNPDYCRRPSCFAMCLLTALHDVQLLLPFSDYQSLPLVVAQSTMTLSLPSCLPPWPTQTSGHSASPTPRYIHTCTCIDCWRQYLLSVLDECMYTEYEFVCIPITGICILYMHVHTH